MALQTVTVVCRQIAASDNTKLFYVRGGVAELFLDTLEPTQVGIVQRIVTPEVVLSSNNKEAEGFVNRKTKFYKNRETSRTQIIRETGNAYCYCSVKAFSRALFSGVSRYCRTDFCPARTSTSATMPGMIVNSRPSFEPMVVDSVLIRTG